MTTLVPGTVGVVGVEMTGIVGSPGEAPPSDARALGAMMSMPKVKAVIVVRRFRICSVAAGVSCRAGAELAPPTNLVELAPRNLGSPGL